MIAIEHTLEREISLHQTELNLISKIETLLDQLLTCAEEDRGFGSAHPENCLKSMKSMRGGIETVLHKNKQEFGMKKDNISLYFHCRDCFKDKPKNTSMEEYSRLSVGRTDEGIQVWCRRHDKQVLHLGFDWAELDEAKPKKCDCHHCEGHPE